MDINDLKHLLVVWFVNVLAWSLAWLPILQAFSFLLAIVYTSIKLYEKIKNIFKKHKDEKKYF